MNRLLARLAPASFSAGLTTLRDRLSFLAPDPAAR